VIKTEKSQFCRKRIAFEIPHLPPLTLLTKTTIVWCNGILQ